MGLLRPPSRISSALPAPAPGGLVLALALGVSGCAVSHEMGTIPPCVRGGSDSEITWYGPLQPNDRRALSARCGTAGSPFIDPNPSAPFGDLANGDSLAVFVWNIDVGAGDLLTFLEREAGLSCRGTHSVASGGIPHSVILVQEAFRRSADLPPLADPRLAARKRVHDPHPHGDPDIVDIAAACGLALAYIPSGRNGEDAPGERRLDKGNAILSTLPLSDIMAVEQPFETERKVAIAASIHIPSAGPLRLANTHLEVAAEFHRTLFSGNQRRVRQAAGLLEALDSREEMTGHPIPTLLAGDFNTWSGMESTLRLLREEFPDSPPWEGHTSMGPFPTDHIFFRAQGAGGIRLIPGTYRILDDKYHSDHQGLVILVEVGGSVENQPATEMER